MKKYNIFKIISISVLVTILLSFLIPSTTFDSYGSATTGNINPVSIIDTFANGITSFSVFLSTFIYILCIGILYFVLKKTGKYDEVINNTAYKFKDKKGLFVVLSILIFGIVTAIIGNITPMLIFVPAFIDILVKLGYDKFTSIISTIGAIILGNTGSLFTNYSNQILQSTVSDNILCKIIILLISLCSLIVFSLFFAKKPQDTKLKKIESKDGKWISIAFDIILFLIILGVTPWNSYFGFEGFNDFHQTITDFKVFDVSVFNSLIGSNISALGQWNLFDLSVLILLISLIVSLIYKFKFDELLETVAAALKKTLPYALIVVLTNIVLVNVYNSGFFYTLLINISKLSDKLFAGTLLSALSAFVYPDYMYASQFSLSSVTAVITDTKFYLILAVVFQAIYSLFLLVTPTSILVLLGLRYTNSNYKDWFKFVFRYALIVFGLLFVVLMILGSKYVNVPSFILLAVIIVLIIISLVLHKNKKEPIKAAAPKKEEKTSEKVVKSASNKQTAKKAETTKTTKKTTTKTNTKSSTKTNTKKTTANAKTTKKNK